MHPIRITAGILLMLFGSTLSDAFQTAHPKNRPTFIDDDLSVQRALKRLFRAHGLHSESFLTAQEFLERVAPRRWCRMH